ncbi:histidine kinase [Vibrio sp. HA2012]|uniref:EAL and HDOD domain-containing protein n=1 Tax=Vibrio sp. HA2012 TaxID=1971595 RepID=UPI000C2C9BF4|nr:HDOD domain-containing protein [Vibrio sp. HA2012]PJC87674.1 histidine kinase [Vibrio sp. HA2012]
MKYSYAARQPILDRERKMIGYELLFRNSPKNTFPEVEPERATSMLLSEQFFGAGNNTADNKLSFVNFPYQSLINQIPTLFPKKKIVVEVLEDCEPTEELLDAIKHLHHKGYKIALDDFVPTPGWIPFLPFIHLIKFDIRIVPVRKAVKFIEKLKGTKIQFLAEKVETYDEFEEAREAGFHFFQGYFFSKPEIIQHKAIDPSFLATVRLCKAIAKDDVDYTEVEQIVSVDVSLSYKLLRYVNSSSAISSKISSFHQAVAYLGVQRLRKFVSLVAIASTQENKPELLYLLSILRARFCELLLGEIQPAADKSQAFLTGMFSLLDSLLDQPLEFIVESIPIDDAIKEALLQRSGLLGDILTLTIAHEQANWDDVNELSDKIGATPDMLLRCYTESTIWAEELFNNQ